MTKKQLKSSLKLTFSFHFHSFSFMFIAFHSLFHRSFLGFVARLCEDSSQVVDHLVALIEGRRPERLTPLFRGFRGRARGPIEVKKSTCSVEEISRSLNKFEEV